MKYDLKNKKLGAPRLWWHKRKKSRVPYIVIKCGCCNEKVIIDYDDHEKFPIALEINGVTAEYDFWRQLFKKIGL